MALTDDQVGPRAAWLRRHRKRKYGTGDGGLVALAKAMRELGFDRSWSTYKGWESSDERSPIPPEAEPYLEQVFREPVPAGRANGSGDSAIVVALEKQTRAINELVTTIQYLLGIEVPPDSPEVAEARRIIREHVHGGMTLAAAEASGSAEGSRRARVHEDPAPLAPSPGQRPLGSGSGRG